MYNHGIIQSAWSLDNGFFEWRIAVPANTTATVYMPVKDGAQVTENGQPVENSEGVTYLRMEAGHALFAVAPGTYIFSTA
jgi:alpha-L-rhamnosidase